MGFFDRSSGLTQLQLRSNPLENPAVPLSTPGLLQLFAGDTTTAGESVTEQNAMLLSTVYACVRTIAESVAILPLKVSEVTATGHRDAIEHPVYRLLTVEANPDQSTADFLETMAACMALTGNAYAEIARNKNKQPVEFSPLHPWRTTPKRDAAGTLYFETGEGLPEGQTRRVEAADCLHFHVMSLQGYKGMSPVDAGRETIGLAKAQEKSGARHFGNNQKPNGAMVWKGAKGLDPKQLQGARESWSQQQGGTNQGKVAFINGAEWEWQSIEISNQASQYIESRALSRADVAALFRVPPHMVGDMSRLSGSNAEQQAQQFLTYTLNPYLRKIESEILRKVLAYPGAVQKYKLEFDTNALVRCDFKTMMDGYSTGRINGWFSTNDVRKKLGENPIGPEGDVYTTPVNYMNAKRLLEVQYPPTQAEDAQTTVDEAVRNINAAYSQAYLPLFRDAFNRANTRNKRDLETIRPIFQPVLEAICSMAVGFRDGKPAAIDTLVTERVVADTLKAMSKRSAKWAEGDTDSEFNKIIRSIHIEVAKTLATATAVDELTPSDEPEDE